MRSGKLAAFAALAVMLSTMTGVGALLGLDLYLHKRFEEVAGLNIWGYRGPTVGRKQPGERRVAVLGGSTAFGYGLTWREAFPAVLERKLNERLAGSGVQRVSVVNLAYNNEGAYSFTYTLEDYEYLDYDVVLLYTGYNDLGKNTQLFRRQSPIFRLTGYFPILPIVLREKAMALRYGGGLEAAYRGKRTVFRPDLVRRMTAGALETTAEISRALERQLGRLVDQEMELTPSASSGCGEPWRHYCQSVFATVEAARNRGRRVLVVTQPYISDAHLKQQRALVAMLKERFGDDPDVRHVNLGRAIDLSDRSLAYDGMHLTPAGNDRIAEGLVESVLEALREEPAGQAGSPGRQAPGADRRPPAT